MVKTSHLEIENINFMKMVWIVLTHRTTLPAGLRLFFSAITEFFIPQFATKLRLSKTPVVSVDHPLDEMIPFDPRCVHTYLNFYAFWIRCTYFLYREFGRRTLADIRDFIDEVACLYYEAGKIYRRCQSTTRRPKFVKMAKFWLIHAVDPHLHCVPSLHVLLVIHTYMTISRLIDKYNDGGAGKYARQKQYIYDTSIEIAESVLFMKQHSVNCIASTLYFMTKLRQEYTQDQAHSFIDNLFAADNGTLMASAAIKEFIRSQYDALNDEQPPEGGDYKEVLLNFLMNRGPVER